ncbi:MAG: 3-hydroxyacyl-CoA dehydrogenase [Alphaproteobacteria bacterium]|nr:3-hydroxyacyl-CoA dehydrogenase [Alphaproteobacteria bacterium]
MSEPVTFTKRGRVGVITVDNPPVNALSNAVRLGLRNCLLRAQAENAVKAIVVIGAGRTFIAGADIREFGRPRDPNSPDLNEVNALFEESPKLTIAAIHGTALGGGYEICLSCHYRVIAKSGQVGLPEVKLGILPGAGGTQRLPRVIGAAPALKIMITGDPVRADAALKLGMVDEVVEGDLLDAACAYAETLIDQGAKPRRLSRERGRLGSVAEVEAAIATYKKENARALRGLFAPFRIMDSVKAAAELPFDKSLPRERELFAECLASPQSRALRHIFFAEREVAKLPDIPKDQVTRKIKTAAILGFGTMGGGIAMNFLNAGIPVKVSEMSREAYDKGFGIVKGNYARTVAGGRLTQAEMDKRLGLLSYAEKLESIGDADIVIEAVFEEMGLKKETFRKLDKVMKKGAILATNTSTLDVNVIAAETSRPEDVIGLHFFSPANVMRLLEIVRAKKTAKDVVATSLELAKTIRKVGVVVGVCDGFVGNRMLHRYGGEAAQLIDEGAFPQDVDKALYEFGLAMGPFAMGDLAGLDVSWRIRKGRRAADPTYPQDPVVADELCELGRFGQKTGAGWYKYEKGDRTPHADPAVDDLIRKRSARLGIQRRNDIAAEEIVERCMYPLVNEGCKILEEGIALRALDIDVIYVNGYGFPVSRGGPMAWAEEVGLPKVLKRIEEFHAKYGARWKPANLLVKLVKEGKTFSRM